MISIVLNVIILGVYKHVCFANSKKPWSGSKRDNAYKPLIYWLMDIHCTCYINTAECDRFSMLHIVRTVLPCFCFRMLSTHIQVYSSYRMLWISTQDIYIVWVTYEKVFIMLPPAWVVSSDVITSPLIKLLILTLPIRWITEGYIFAHNFVQRSCMTWVPNLMFLSRTGSFLIFVWLIFIFDNFAHSCR